jgi:hypothetical protein
MKRILVTLASATALFCVFAIGVQAIPQNGDSIAMPTAHAQDPSDAQSEGQRNGFDVGRTRNCSSGILRGRYALSLSGTIIGLGPAAEIGSITFDGAGTFKGTLRASINGQSLPRSVTGTYVVNPDCTGTISADITPGGPIELSLVMVDSAGQKAVVIVTSPGLVFSGTLETN